MSWNMTFAMTVPSSHSLYGSVFKYTRDLRVRLVFPARAVFVERFMPTITASWAVFNISCNVGRPPSSAAATLMIRVPQI